MFAGVAVPNTLQLGYAAVERVATGKGLSAPGRQDAMTQGEGQPVVAYTKRDNGSEQTTGELVAKLSRDMSRLVRDEIRLAQAELAGSGKKAGLGAGMFGAAGLIAVFAGGCFVAAAVLAVDLALAAWLSALLVGIGLVLVAGIAALAGRRQVKKVASPVPKETVRSVRADIETVKESAKR